MRSGKEDKRFHRNIEKGLNLNGKGNMGCLPGTSDISQSEGEIVMDMTRRTQSKIHFISLTLDLIHITMVDMEYSGVPDLCCKN